MKKTISTLEDILTPLFQIQASAWRDRNSELKPSKRALTTYRTISGTVPPITLEETRFVYKPPNYVLGFFSAWKGVIPSATTEQSREFCANSVSILQIEPNAEHRQTASHVNPCRQEP